jgi:hypothetical protein
MMLDFVLTPTFAEWVTFLGAGQVDAGLIPYTSFVALFDAGAPVRSSRPAVSRGASWWRSRDCITPRS